MSGESGDSTLRVASTHRASKTRTQLVKIYKRVSGTSSCRAHPWPTLQSAMTVDEALSRIRREFQEMPDLKLTLAQVRRLCDLPAEACDSAVAVLVDSGFLRQTNGGRFTAA